MSFTLGDGEIVWLDIHSSDFEEDRSTLKKKIRLSGCRKQIFKKNLGYRFFANIEYKRDFTEIISSVV